MTQSAIKTMAKQASSIVQSGRCPLEFAERFSLPPGCFASPNRRGGLAIGLPTLIAMAPMLGHHLDDRKVVAKRQASDLASRFVQASEIPLPDQVELQDFFVAPLDILPFQRAGERHFQLLELNGTGVGGLTNMSGDVKKSWIQSVRSGMPARGGRRSWRWHPRGARRRATASLATCCMRNFFSLTGSPRLSRGALAMWKFWRLIRLLRTADGAGPPVRRCLYEEGQVKP
jgi:hypothetical protein